MEQLQAGGAFGKSLDRGVGLNKENGLIVAQAADHSISTPLLHSKGINTHELRDCYKRKTVQTHNLHRL